MRLVEHEWFPRGDLNEPPLPMAHEHMLAAGDDDGKQIVSISIQHSHANGDRYHEHRISIDDGKVRVGMAREMVPNQGRR